MKEVLDETYGIMVYQEQVMRICNRLGDIPLREAYTLIKAISKKKASTIQKEKERFVTARSPRDLKNSRQKTFSNSSSGSRAMALTKVTRPATPLSHIRPRI